MPRASNVLIRFFIYGMIGWCIEIVFTATRRALFGTAGRWRLEGSTSVWVFPIYGSIAFLFEPLHDAMRGAVPLVARALLYGIGFIVVEYVSGWILRRATGACPWDYSGRTRYTLHGLTRFDYLPFWILLGLVLEPIHDALVRLTPAIRAVVG